MFFCVNRVSDLSECALHFSVDAVATPLTVSVFLLEVVADDTPAVQAVLKADTRRLRLLEEEKQLQARLEKGEDSVAERLEKVRVFVCVHACVCDALKPNWIQIYLYTTKL